MPLLGSLVEILRLHSVISKEEVVLDGSEAPVRIDAEALLSTEKLVPSAVLNKSEYPKYTPLLAKILEGVLSRSNIEDKFHHFTEVKATSRSQDPAKLTFRDCGHSPHSRIPVLVIAMFCLPELCNCILCLAVTWEAPIISKSLPISMPTKVLKHPRALRVQMRERHKS
uniref:Uncharacterized protein n=1 Tax=Solanum lycopersicum TaxID=4081 RepID=A0A3Q7FER2_SOLLC